MHSQILAGCIQSCWVTISTSGCLPAEASLRGTRMATMTVLRPRQRPLWIEGSRSRLTAIDPKQTLAKGENPPEAVIERQKRGAIHFRK